MGIFGEIALWSFIAALLVAMIAAWCQYSRLKRTPAVTATTRHAGLKAIYVHAGPYRIFARVSIDGEDMPHIPAILVHGLVISSRYMEPLAEALRHHVTVMAPDLPDFGESDKPPHALTLVELADALHAWLRACEIPRAILIGNSFGCQILVELAIRHPEVIDRFVLQGPTTDPKARYLLFQIWRDFLNQRREPGNVGRIARIDYAKAGLFRAFATMKILIRDRIEEKLSLIEAPVLVVHGTRDPVAPRDWARQVSTTLPHGRFVAIEGGTHTLNYAYPNEMAEAILPFLLADREQLLQGVEA